MKITNDYPIGLYIGSIYNEITVGRDRVIIEQQDRANKAIKFFGDKPATRENCQALIGYLREYQAIVAVRPDCEAKTELMDQLTETIETLQTGVDRERTVEIRETKKDEESDYGRMLRQSYDRWQVWGWQKRPIVRDPNKLEGYLRKIPGIAGMDYMNLINKYATDIIFKFFPPKPSDTKTDEDARKYVDKCVAQILHTFAFVQLTSQRQTYQVIENQYDDADELYEFAITQGMEEAAELATVGTK